MSRFHSFEWEGLKVKVRPTGWSHRWLPFLPYRTGDYLDIYVSIAGTPTGNVAGIDYSLQLGNGIVETRDGGALTNLKQPIRFHRVAPSGQYQVVMRFYERVKHPGIIGFRSDGQKIADIQVIQDYKVWAALGGLLLLGIGAGIAKFIEWGIATHLSNGVTK